MYRRRGRSSSYILMRITGFAEISEILMLKLLVLVALNSSKVTKLVFDRTRLKIHVSHVPWDPCTFRNVYAVRRNFIGL